MCGIIGLAGGAVAKIGLDGSGETVKYVKSRQDRRKHIEKYIWKIGVSTTGRNERWILFFGRENATTDSNYISPRRRDIILPLLDRVVNRPPSVS